MLLPDRVALLCRNIHEKGQAAAQEVRETSIAKAAQRVAEAKQQVRAALEAFRVSKRQETFVQVRKREDAAVLKARQMVLHAKEEALHTLYLDLEQRLHAQQATEAYPGILQQLALQAIRQLPGDRMWIQVRQADQGLVDTAFCALLAAESGRKVKVQLLPEPAAISGGCLVVSGEQRILIDCSFTALLDRNLPRLRELFTQRIVEEQ